MTVFETVPAASLCSAAPDDLTSLRFCVRPSVGPTVRLCVVGDIALSGRVGDTAALLGHSTLLQDVEPAFSVADVVFGNLESPLTDRPRNGALFAASPTSAPVLASAGFTLLHIANNHAGDHGPGGLSDTLEALRASHVLCLGAGAGQTAARELIRTDRNGLRIGWLGCGRTLQHQGGGGPAYWEFDEAELIAAIRQARPAVDVLIVSIHIGLMYLDYPLPEYRALAHRLCAEGATLVLMHHAHVLQGIEVTGDGSVICHNLGNFLVDWQEGNVIADVVVKEQNEGAIFLFDLDSRGICLAAALPTCIDETCCVRWATGSRGEQIRDRMTRISGALDKDYTLAFWRQRASRNFRLAWRVLWFHFTHRNWAVVRQILATSVVGNLKGLPRIFSSILRSSLRRAARWG